MAKNQWEVEIVTNAEDFGEWHWVEAFDGEDEVHYGEAYAAFVREVSIRAAKIMSAELVKGVMLDLRATDRDATFHTMLFEGNLEFSMSIGALVDSFIEIHENRHTRKISNPEYHPEAERIAAQFEQAAARIRAAME
jgi:hypothetical protein